MDRLTIDEFQRLLADWHIPYSDNLSAFDFLNAFIEQFGDTNFEKIINDVEINRIFPHTIEKEKLF